MKSQQVKTERGVSGEGEREREREEWINGVRGRVLTKMEMSWVRNDCR